MSRTTFKFDLPAPERLSLRSQERRRAELEALIRPLFGEPDYGEWEFDLDSPKLPELVRILQRLHKTKAAWISFVEIVEHIPDDAEASAEWFILDPEDQSHLDMCFMRHLKEEQVYPFGNAASAKPGMHIADWGPASMLVSERFKAVVEKHRLTGLEFLWIRDTGRYQALQWYLPLPRELLGRGLDHPWYDPAKSTEEGSDAEDLRARHGEQIASSLGGFCLRSDASFGDPVKDRLLKLAITMSKGRMLVRSYPRFLRQYLPRTDFAATLCGCSYGTEIWPDCGLAVNRRARDLLVANRVVTPEQCIAVKLFDRAPKGVENLDRQCGEPVPLFSTEELARLRAEEAKLWAEHVRHPKPPRVPNLPRTLSLLRSAKRREPKDFPRPATPRAIAEASRALGIAIPAAWQKVLRISNGGKIANSPLASEQACLIAPIEKLAKSHREETDFFREIGAPLPKGLLLIVQTEIGDSIWLDTNRKQKDGDCRVVLMSHETGEEEREWPSVAEFLEELLTATAD